MTIPPTDRFTCTGPCVRGTCGVSAGAQPCGSCCECRLTCDGPEPVAEQPVRHTVDTITDNDLDALYAALDEARRWARHGYEIGQRTCTWADHGVAPAWLTEGWPLHFPSQPEPGPPCADNPTCDGGCCKRAENDTP